MTGAAIAVVLVAAGGVFLISPYNHVAWLGGHPGPSTSLASGQTITLPAPVAPAATLARAPTPETVTSPPLPPPTQQPKPEELQEIVRLRSGDGARPTPAGEAHAPTPISPPAQRQYDAQHSAPATPSVSAACSCAGIGAGAFASSARLVDAGELCGAGPGSGADAAPRRDASRPVGHRHRRPA